MCLEGRLRCPVHLAAFAAIEQHRKRCFHSLVTPNARKSKILSYSNSKVGVLCSPSCIWKAFWHQWYHLSFNELSKVPLSRYSARYWSWSQMLYWSFSMASSCNFQTRNQDQFYSGNFSLLRKVTGKNQHKENFGSQDYYTSSKFSRCCREKGPEIRNFESNLVNSW